MTDPVSELHLVLDLVNELFAALATGDDETQVTALERLDKWRTVGLTERDEAAA